MNDEQRNRLAAESQGLGWRGNERFVIGHVWDVNGEGAVLVEDFQPTRHELEVLARYYLDEALFIAHFERCTESSGSDERRTRWFAERRLDTICGAIGQEAFDAAVADVHSKWDAEFEKMAEAERQLPPCSQCGGKLTLADKAYADDGASAIVCGSCQLAASR